MLKQRVVVKGPAGRFAGKEGIVVAVNMDNNKFLNDDKNVVCKVLIDDTVSHWIPYQWLEEIKQYMVS